MNNKVTTDKAQNTDFETKTVIRKVFYYYSDGSKVMDIDGKHAVATQTADFTRRIITDPKTGEKKPEDWAEVLFGEMPVVNIEGFSANMSKIPPVMVSPDNPPEDIKVIFTRIDPSFRGVRLVNGVWTYFSDGKENFSFTGVARSIRGNWIFVKNGVFNTEYSGAAKSTMGNWLYVSSGRWQPSYNGIAKMIDSEKQIYMSKGRWDQTFNGTVDGFEIKNGYVV